jgi:hypothetical protein
MPFTGLCLRRYITPQAGLSKPDAGNSFHSKAGRSVGKSLSVEMLLGEPASGVPVRAGLNTVAAKDCRALAIQLEMPAKVAMNVWENSLRFIYFLQEDTSHTIPIPFSVVQKKCPLSRVFHHHPTHMVMRPTTVVGMKHSQCFIPTGE